MEDYYQDKKQKRNDLLLGILISFCLAIAGIFLGWLVLAFGLGGDFSREFAEGPFNTPLMRAIAFVIIFLLIGIPEFLLIRKHLKKRRYIAIGMISAIILPFLVVGVCTPLGLFLA
jgi:hypothetical protein